MDFYIKNKDNQNIATFEYLTSKEDCAHCKGIIIKKGSLISKNTFCLERYNGCMLIDNERDIVINSSDIKDYNDEFYITVNDIVHNSVYVAVSVVLGHTESHAWELLVNDQSQTLKEVYRT